MKPRNNHGNNESQSDDKTELVQQLTQVQYELSQELDQGISKLKQVIGKAEKYICQAKGRYQK